MSEQKSTTCGEKQGKKGRKQWREGGRDEGKKEWRVVWAGSSFSVMSTHLPAHTDRQTICMQAKEPGGEWKRRERERRQLQEAEPA